MIPVVLAIGDQIVEAYSRIGLVMAVVASSFVPSDFLVDGQVSELGTVCPLLTLGFFSTWILPLHVVFFPLLFCVQNPSAMDDGGWLRIGGL